MKCAVCNAGLDRARPGRRDTCPSCGAELHACVQCEFYAPGRYNDCREPQAERVRDSEKANFCDFFRLRGEGGAPTGTDSKDEVRARLDALFSKKKS